jgi:hypothetical protein
MALDIIYLIIATPVTIAVMYGTHKLRKALRTPKTETPEATPYVFERDKPVEGFKEFSEMLYQRRMYRGGQEL